jgi:hypothetical protein
VIGIVCFIAELKDSKDSKNPRVMGRIDKFVLRRSFDTLFQNSLKSRCSFCHRQVPLGGGHQLSH